MCVCCSVMQCVSVCCSVLQRDAVCCSALQHVFWWCARSSAVCDLTHGINHVCLSWVGVYVTWIKCRIVICIYLKRVYLSTRTQSLSLFPSLSLSHTHTLSLSCTHTLTHTNSHTHTHTFTNKQSTRWKFSVKKFLSEDILRVCYREGLGFGFSWQCAAVCCSVLQCAAVCCSVLRCVVVCGSMLQYVSL